MASAAAPPNMLIRPGGYLLWSQGQVFFGIPLLQKVRVIFLYAEVIKGSFLFFHGYRVLSLEES